MHIHTKRGVNHNYNISQGDRIVIERIISTKRKNIKELFEGYEGEYKRENIDWGSPEGEEIW